MSSHQQIIVSVVVIKIIQEIQINVCKHLAFILRSEASKFKNHFESPLNAYQEMYRANIVKYIWIIHHDLLVLEIK